MRALGIAAMVLMAPCAQALDCVAPQAAQSFKNAEASPTEIVIVLGRFTFDAGLLMGDVGQDGVELPPIPGQFVGRGLTQDGFTSHMNISVDVQQVCAGIWCGHADSLTQEAIAFLDLVDGRYVLDLLPCGSGVYPADPETIALLSACMKGDACEPAFIQ